MQRLPLAAERDRGRGHRAGAQLLAAAGRGESGTTQVDRTESGDRQAQGGADAVDTLADGGVEAVGTETPLVRCDLAAV
ncbi:hypothetical protein DCW30_07505 [Streptomyces alfalfae]|uniref:Uncharacterized protein n=1 Tax=Streptomyces alfalfae TaxID=1642299 RepID=A0ABN4VIB5_9ACTN|nr:hypothetical protein A7J05_02940 [Streptomyces alfalfae]AYA15168.1 hypothetical protein D3X13_01815 [Streptomyces fradiae]RXX45726.1 hypothetical protein DCW30_07505 [Streptomyces alfalfae]RZM94478.1 hypothetical protein D4104_18470 [Streptomyces alfalfae]